MIKVFLEQIKLIFNPQKYSILTITVFSILTFYVYMTINAILIYQQFNIFEILSVSFVFLTLLILLSMLFYKDFFQEKLKWNIQNIIIAFFILIFIIYLSNSLSPMWLYYYHIFPLLDSELGLGWHQDSVFHVSIIQSILNKGYPSIGQHGSPVLIYHVLSHYMDAFILYLTGLEPYDSYGLFFHFKIFLLISTITTFIAYVFRKVKAYIFLIALLLILPIIIGTWHAIGSHGLWFTSIFLLFSSPLVFNIITKDEESSLLDFIIIFLIIIVITLGKVSTGFMYASFIGFYLLLKYPKKLEVYLMGTGWLLFFFIYKTLMRGDTGSIDAKYNFSWFKFDILYQHIFSGYAAQTAIFATLFLLLGLSFIFKNAINTRFTISAIISYIVLVFLTKSNTIFSSSDVWYFYYGLSSVLILVTIQNIGRSILIYKSRNKRILSGVDKKLLTISLIFTALYLSGFYISPIINKTVKPHINTKFVKTNSKIDESEKVSYKHRIREPFSNLISNEIDRPLLSFRRELNSFLMLVGVVFAMKWKLEVTGFSAVYFTVSTAILIYSLMVLKINFPDVYLPWRHRIIEIDWPFWRATFTEAFPFGIAMTFMVIFYWIDSVILSLMKGNTVVGYYNASYRIVLALQFIPNSFITAIYPVMSKYYETSRNSLEASFVNSFTYLLILGVPIGFGTTILAKPIISLIYGIDYTLSVPALQILIWSMVFIFMSQPFGNLFNCVNRQAVVSKTTGICVGLNIILNIILIPKYSLIGASIATLITEVASLILLVFWSTEIFLTIPDAKTLAVTGAKILISSAVMSLYTLYFINMSLFALIPSATVLYFIVLFFLNGISGKDISFIMNLIKWR